MWNGLMCSNTEQLIGSMGGADYIGWWDDDDNIGKNGGGGGAGGGGSARNVSKLPGKDELLVIRRRLMATVMPEY